MRLHSIQSMLQTYLLIQALALKEGTKKKKTPQNTLKPQITQAHIADFICENASCMKQYFHN